MTTKGPSGTTPSWMQLDAIDFVVVTLTAAALALVYAWLQLGSPVFSGAFVLVPLIVRRRYFPMPSRGVPKKGVWWSLSSILAGVTLCLGVVVFGFGTWAFFEYAKAEPDHSSEIAPALERFEPSATPLRKPGESDEQFTRRFERGIGLSRENYRAKLLAERHDVWRVHRAHMGPRALYGVLAGLAMMFLGGLVDRLRYRAAP